MNQLTCFAQNAPKTALSKKGCKKKAFIAGKKRSNWLENNTFNLSRFMVVLKRKNAQPSLQNSFFLFLKKTVH